MKRLLLISMISGVIFLSVAPVSAQIERAGLFYNNTGFRADYMKLQVPSSPFVKTVMKSDQHEFIFVLPLQIDKGISIQTSLPRPAIQQVIQQQNIFKQFPSTFSNVKDYWGSRYTDYYTRIVQEKEKKSSTMRIVIGGLIGGIIGTVVGEGIGYSTAATSDGVIVGAPIGILIGVNIAAITK